MPALLYGQAKARFRAEPGSRNRTAVTLGGAPGTPVRATPFTSTQRAALNQSNWCYELSLNWEVPIQTQKVIRKQQFVLRPEFAPATPAPANLIDRDAIDTLRDSLDAVALRDPDVRLVREMLAMLPPNTSRSTRIGTASCAR